MSLIKFITKRIRTNKVRKFINDKNGKFLLDIGCGDGFFINSFKNINAIGIDKKFGDDVEKGLKYKDETFDYITMLAVIEHLDNYKPIIAECNRVLKNGGLLLITTPFKKAEKFIKLYCHNSLDHKQYFIKKNFEKLMGFDLIHYSTFEFGLNQLVVLKKK